MLLEPLVRELRELRVYVQDDPAYLADIGAHHNATLEHSFRHNIEMTPTLIRLDMDGAEDGSPKGWVGDEWRQLLGLPEFGIGLRERLPGCGSKSREPGVYEHSPTRFGNSPLLAQQIELGEWDDPVEACFERGWTDGLLVVPPTDERILRMLKGTTRSLGAIIGLVPLNLSECTVEKVAINAVMAGCKPEYLPVVLATLEAVPEPLFTMRGLLCTTCSAGPIIVVNGPIARAIGINWGINVLGQGNRANATIGRALQLIIRNVGGRRPGEIDRATFGTPGKYTFCFAEDDTDPTWQPLSVARGVPPGTGAVSLL